MIKYIFRTLFWLLMPLMTACVSDMETPFAEESGRLQLSLANISVETRSTPSELGVPVASDFQLRIISPSGRAVYDGVFTEDEITLPVASYSVIVTYGNDAELAIDQPYYYGETEVEIKENTLVNADINVSVGNALVSAIFGADENETARFDRFYSDYALYVCIDNRSIPITKAAPRKSIYVRAHSHVTLRFWGKLKMDDDRVVSMELKSADFPETLSAAEHAIVTLTLPDPESALGLDIAKVEVQELTLDETIPLSWLPPAVTVPQHQYDADGCLVGTNLLITDAFPGQKWRAVITNQAGTTVRSVEGTGSLESRYNSSANASAWPYLPQGQYTANYYLIDAGNQVTYQNSRAFTVPAPKVSIAVGGYTSYDKYLAGDIDAANACERLTVYEPSVAVNISNSLLGNSNYAYSFTYTYDGAQYSVDAGMNSYGLETLPGQPVRRDVYTLRGDVTFDGVSATARRDFRITGLPYSLNLKDHGEWDSSSGVDWFDNDVRLGHLSTGGQNISTEIAVCLPPSTYYCADYNVNVHSATIGTTFSITVGSQTILSIRENGGIGQNKDNLHSGTTNTFHDDSNYLTKIVCRNSYGAGQTCTHIYSFTLKYAKP